MAEKHTQISIKAAKEAGKILMKYYGKVKKIVEKSPNNYVTEADLESEKIIIGLIKKNFPAHQIISEEAGSINRSDHVWYVDPLDGTHNYIHKIPFFGVSIAYSYKGEVKAGVIYCPYVDELYVAEKGKGAFCNGKKIEVSKKDRVKDVIVIFDASLHKDKEYKFNLLRKFVDSCFKVRILGAAVYNCISVAIGGAEAYIELSTNPWDIAAGLLIVQEAGGKVTDLEGDEWKPDIKEFIATNGIVHKKILDIIS